MPKNHERIAALRSFSEKLLTEQEEKSAQRHIKGIESILEKAPERKKRLHVTELFQFRELSPEAQKKALEDARNINVDFSEWAEAVTENFKEKLEARGYKNPTTYYSGFWSQGDGACFVTDYIDIAQLLKAAKIEKRFPLIVKESYNVTGKITHSSHYYYATSTSVDVQQLDYAESEALSAEIEALTAFIEEDREKLGNGYYKELETEYKYQTSDEAIAETLITNDYDYHEDGRRFRA